jgi:hypothetical protein
MLLLELQPRTSKFIMNFCFHEKSCYCTYTFLYLFVLTYVSVTFALDWTEGHAITQVLRRRLLTAEARVCAQVIPVDFMVDRVAFGQVFLAFLRIHLLSFHSCSIFNLVSSGEWTLGLLETSVSYNHCLSTSSRRWKEAECKYVLQMCICLCICVCTFSIRPIESAGFGNLHRV